MFDCCQDYTQSAYIVINPNYACGFLFNASLNTCIWFTHQAFNQWFHWVDADWAHRPYNRLGHSGAWAVWCPTVANSPPGIWFVGVELEPRYNNMAEQVAFFSSGSLWVVIFLRFVAVGLLISLL